MKVMVKSKEELLSIFKEDNWVRTEFGYSKEGLLFDNAMFRYCGLEIEVKEMSVIGYDFADKDYCWKKEWLEISNTKPVRGKEVKVGDTIEYKGAVFKCVQSDPMPACDLCSFAFTEMCERLACGGKIREDNTNVYFEKV